MYEDSRIGQGVIGAALLLAVLLLAGGYLAGCIPWGIRLQ